MKILAFGFFIMVIATHCKTKTSLNQNDTDASAKPSQDPALIKPATINEEFITGNELMTDDLVELKIIDTSVTTRLGETCYCDTTIQLNDSISYSIISANDMAGLCTYFFVASFNKKNGKIIASKYLNPDCDVDFSLDSYDLHEHTIVGKDKIEITKTTIFQKKNRTSLDEDENIDHKQTKKDKITISQAGQINAIK